MTTLLRRVKNIFWRHPTRDMIYGDLFISFLVKARRIRFACPCHRSENKASSSLILLEPQPHGKRTSPPLMSLGGTQGLGGRN